MGCWCSRFFLFQRERERVLCKQIHFPVPQNLHHCIKKMGIFFFLGPNEIVAIYLLKRSQLSIQIRFCRVGWCCCCWWIVRLLLSDAKIWKLSNNNLTEYLQHIYSKLTLWKSDYCILDDFKFLVWIHFSMPVQREIFYFRIGKSFWHRVLCFEDAAARWPSDARWQEFCLVDLENCGRCVLLVVRDFDAGVSQ